MTDDDTERGLSWEAWARILGRDPATLDVDEIITADMRLGADRRRLASFRPDEATGGFADGKEVARGDSTPDGER
jgi:hypothetical protein